MGEVTNGKRWLVKEGENFVHIAKVSGNSYEMGYALGQMFGEELAETATAMIDVYSI